MHSRRARCWRLREGDLGLSPSLSPAGSDGAADPRGDAPLCCHSRYREETKGSEAAVGPRRAVSKDSCTGAGAGVSLAPSASARYSLGDSTEECLPKGEKKDQPFSALHLGPQGWPLSSRSHPAPNPLPAGLGSWVQRG